MKKEQLGTSIEAYSALRRSMGLAEGSIRNEVRVTMRLLEIVGNIYTHNLTEVHVTRYFEQVAQTRSPSSLRLDHVYLGSFFDWARRTGRMPMSTDPMAGRRAPKPVKVERQRIHVSKFPHLLDCAEERHPRNRAIIATGLYTLARDQEMARLRISDVGLDAGFIHLRISKSYTEDHMPICAELDAELRRWYTAYAQECGPLQPDWYLFPKREMGNRLGLLRDDGGRLLPGNYVVNPEKRLKVLSHEVRHALRSSGWASEQGLRNEGSHTLRRSGARALYDALVEDGHDYAVRIVMTMLHHASMTTTEHYIGVTADRRSRDTIIRGHVMFKSVAEATVLKVAQ